MLQSWMLLQELAGPLAAVLSLGAALAAAYAARKAAKATRAAAADAHLKIFLQFADEYEKLKVALPVVGDKNPEHVYLTAMGQPKYQLGVFNVCRLFEREHQLHKLKLVPKKIWHIWQRDMLELFAHKPVRDFVLKNRDQFRPSFINDVVEK
ncbi:MAG TPA: hypothetical protein VHP58_00290 [Alphaproteobacteria bacterium]|nr:hypothetical protein [Alphaproteobacteria bacterium]